MLETEKAKGAWEIEKNKEGQSPTEATLAACKILLQRVDTGTHSLVGWTWKD